MVWRELGTLSPNLLAWQPFPLPTVGEVFRVRQVWAGDWPGTGWANLSGVYGENGRFGITRIYPDLTPTLITFPTPAPLTALGLTERTLILRLATTARIYGTANWQISIDDWI